MANITKIEIDNTVYDIKDNRSMHFFDTVSDLKASTILKNGDYVNTTGYYNVNDGGDANYYIRTKSVSDVTDDMLIIELSDNTLVAELNESDSVRIKQLGAKGDGTNDDSDYIITALTKYNEIIFNEGLYLITKTITIPRNNITFKGISYNASKLQFNTNGNIEFIGTSILSSGTHKNYFTIDSLSLNNNTNVERSTPYLNLICCSYVKLLNSWFYGTGKQILMWECFDSRVINCDFEWGGSSTSNIAGFELRSTNGGDNTLPTYEYTNNIYFNDCRFESHIGRCVSCTGNNTNKIIFDSCKFESYNCVNQNAIRFTNASSIYFNNCILAGDVSNTENYLYIDSVNNFTLSGYCEQGNPHGLSYNNKRLIYCTGTGERVIKIALNNNGAYTIDTQTFGLDTWIDNSNDLFKNAEIHVNDLSNEGLITSRNSSVATLSSGSTSLNYTASENGWIYVTMSGTWGQSSPQRISIKNTTANYNLMLITIADNYVSGFMPVAKGDTIICDGNSSEIAYITFYASKGYNLQ